MTGFVARHFVHGVVDCVEPQLLRSLCKIDFALGCAEFGIYAQLKILFGGIGDYLAQKLAERGQA